MNDRMQKLRAEAHADASKKLAEVRERLAAMPKNDTSDAAKRIKEIRQVNEQKLMKTIANVETPKQKAHRIASSIIEARKAK